MNLLGRRMTFAPAQLTQDDQALRGDPLAAAVEQLDEIVLIFHPVVPAATIRGFGARSGTRVDDRFVCHKSCVIR
jgi:hypothetical protein